MKRFLRYLCFYCLSRFTYNALARLLRARPAKPCEHHGGGAVLTLLLLPFVGAVALVVMGFLQW